MKLLQSISLVIFIMVLVNCSGNSGKDLFEKAKKQIKSKNYSEAMASFKTIVEKYPKTEEARKSLFEIANLYQGKVLKNISSKESLKNAVKFYKEIFDKYPDSKDASKALFMAGFTAANDLQNYDEAKKLYNLYLEKFPKGKLATDAKIELANLGKSPEEILKDKIKANKNE